MKGYDPILEIARCIEEQFEPDTRLILMACGGLWKNPIFHKGRPNLKSPYEKWIEELFWKAFRFCKKEKLLKNDRRYKRAFKT